MSEYIKLVRDDYTTHWGDRVVHWKIGTTVKAAGRGKMGLCSDTVLHLYETGAVAALMAPIHGVDDYPKAVLVEVSPRQKIVTDGTKIGVRSCRVLCEISRPTLTTEQRVAIGIVCAARAYDEPGWREWAQGWLSGEDRSGAAAWATLVATKDTAHRTAAARRAARLAAAAADPTAAVGGEAVWLARSAVWLATHVNIGEICDLVLSTPESEWGSLMEVNDE